MIALLLLVACDNPCKAGSTPTMALGEGAETYGPLADGDTLDLVFGQQGGYHLELAVETTYLEADDLLAGFLTGTLDGEVVASGQPWFQLDCDATTDTQKATGLRLILEVEPEDVHDQTLDVVAEIGDSTGASLVDQRQIHVNNPY